MSRNPLSSRNAKCVLRREAFFEYPPDYPQEVDPQAALAGVRPDQVVALDAPDRALRRVERSVEAVGSQAPHHLLDPEWPTPMHEVWSHEIRSRDAGEKLLVDRPLCTPHQIERHERLVLQLVARSVRLHQPLAAQPLAVLQDGEKTALVPHRPSLEMMVLLVGG